MKAAATNTYSNLLSSLKAKKKIIFNSLWVIVDKVVRMFGGIVVGIWFARYLGPDKYGAWNYAYSIVNLGIPFINLGLTNVLLTDLIKTENKGRALFTGMLLKLMSGTVVALIVYLFSFTLKNEQLTRTLLIILSFQCFFQAFDVFDLFYQSRIESKNSVFAKTSAYIVVNILKVWALLSGFSLVVFGLFTVAEMVIAAAILIYFYFNISKQSVHEWKFDWSLAKNLLDRSWPFIIAELLISLYTRLDQVMLKNMIGNAELGKYSAATRLSELWYFIASAITISLYPTIVKLREKGETEFLQGFQKLFNILVTISVFISIFFTFTADFITSKLFGVKYPGIGNILSIHIWTGVFVYLGVGCGNWFILNNLQRYIIMRTATGFVINVILNLFLIPRYQSVGAAVATLVAQAFASVISNAFSSKTRVIFRLQMKAFLVFVRPSVKNYI